METEKLQQVIDYTKNNPNIFDKHKQFKIDFYKQYLIDYPYPVNPTFIERKIYQDNLGLAFTIAEEKYFTELKKEIIK